MGTLWCHLCIICNFIQRGDKINNVNKFMSRNKRQQNFYHTSKWKGWNVMCTSNVNVIYTNMHHSTIIKQVELGLRVRGGRKDGKHLVSLESSWQGGVQGLGSMMFGLAVQKFLNVEFFLLNFKLNHFLGGGIGMCL
jgi:hypothetical protein